MQLARIVKSSATLKVSENVDVASALKKKGGSAALGMAGIVKIVTLTN